MAADGVEGKKLRFLRDLGLRSAAATSPPLCGSVRLRALLLRTPAWEIFTTPENLLARGHWNDAVSENYVMSIYT